MNPLEIVLWAFAFMSCAAAVYMWVYLFALIWDWLSDHFKLFSRLEYRLRYWGDK